MFIADFHIHSAYSRATSRDSEPIALDKAARERGLHLLGSGDFSHPAYRLELREKLVPAEEGLYVLNPQLRQPLPGALAEAPPPRFIISGEISCIYKKNGRVRKVHHLILLPSLEDAERLALRLEKIGNLHSDGRPILGLDSRDLLEITLEACPQAIFIPAHIWTPHFSLFGAYSGFDSIEECFEDLTPHIVALETGLSSDPAMNYRISALDRFTLVSNSDAHSPAKLAREANLFNCPLSYPDVAAALADRYGNGFAGTIEFFPEEGKYHYDGHRSCNIVLSPAETKAQNYLCPVCGGKITVGVSHRVEELADRAFGVLPKQARPFESLVPLPEIIAAASGLSGAGGKKVQALYQTLLQELGPELEILRQLPLAEIEAKSNLYVAEGIRRLRCREVSMSPGYDGVYGKLQLFDQQDWEQLSGQTSLFVNLAAMPMGDIGSNDSAAPMAAPTTAETAPAPDAAAAESTIMSMSPLQWQAVSSTARTIAVEAGPGSGKTRTLVNRIIHLIEQKKVPPQQITAVTFTNKAAQEMRQRLEAHFADKEIVRQLQIGTFHSICLGLLQQWRLPTTLLDAFEARTIAGESAKQLQLKWTPRKAQAQISAHKNMQPEATASETVAALRDCYDQQLQMLGVLDFDDILLRVLERFKAEPGLAPQSFQHLLVDEVQDLNETQHQLIAHWTKHGQGLFAIGDPNQSIYGFRGATMHCFARLQRDYPGLEHLVLQENYRSTPQIVQAGQLVIAGNGAQPALSAKKASGDKLQWEESSDAYQEAIYIAKEIAALVGGVDMLQSHAAKKTKGPEQIGFSDIAVLYRTHKQSEQIEECLRKEGIPCRIVGRDEGLSANEIRNGLAFFRFLLNPKDLVSLRRSLLGLEVAEEMVQKILADYAASKQTIAAFLQSPLLTAAETANLSLFASLVEQYAPRVKKEKPSKLWQSWIDDNHLGGIASLQMLLEVSLRYRSMAALLQALLLGEEADIERNAGKTYAADAVLLSTLHGTKGLEFPIVFLAGLKDGLLPLRQADGSCEMEEERRLAYVGITRAEQRLYLLTEQPTSPFLANIPAELLQYNQQKKRPIPTKQLSLF